MNRLTKIGLLAGVPIIALSVIIVLSLYKNPQPAVKKTNPVQPQASQATQPTKPEFDQKMYSLSDPTSIWVVVNKQRPLNPKQYVPMDLVVPKVPLRVAGSDTMQLRTASAAALEQMFAAAKEQSLSLMLSSGYRSYEYQVSLYNGYVAKNGQASADKFSARPGHSEHQTGLAADIEPTSKKCEIDRCFADTPEGKWLAANAYKYGFTIRYPADKTSVTGYEYEPWHVRYVGNELAAELQTKQITTLEEYFGLGAAPSY